LKRQPGIYTLGISASKFVEINKTKPANSIHKYFCAASKSENDTAANNSEEEESSENLATHDSFSHKDSETQETSTSTSSSLKNDIKNLLLKQGSKKSKPVSAEDDSENDAENLGELSHDSQNTDASSNREDIREPKKTTQGKHDIKKLLLNQNSKKTRYFDDDDSNGIEIVEIENKCDDIKDKDHQTKTTKQTSSSSLGSVENNEPKMSGNEQIFTDVDYVICNQCKKKILCWEMPEHEDFHYAQLISRQFASAASTSAEQSEANSRKRSTAEETPNKIKDKKDLKNSKKAKTNSEINKPAIKSIDNYFKKKP
jgi:hypothetical protein